MESQLQPVSLGMRYLSSSSFGLHEIVTKFGLGKHIWILTDANIFLYMRVRYEILLLRLLDCSNLFLPFLTGLLRLHCALHGVAAFRKVDIPRPVLPRILYRKDAQDLLGSHHRRHRLGHLSSLRHDVHLLPYPRVLGPLRRSQVHPQPNTMVLECGGKHHHRHCRLCSSSPSHQVTGLAPGPEVGSLWHF